MDLAQRCVDWLSLSARKTDEKNKEPKPVNQNEGELGKNRKKKNDWNEKATNSVDVASDVDVSDTVVVVVVVVFFLFASNINNNG